MNPLAQTAPRQAYFPGDPKWDDVRRAWNLAVDQQPAAVFVPESADDVAEAVDFARRNGLRVALQGTGHGAAPLGSLEDTVLVKTHLMQEIEIDCARRRARAGAGVIWEQVVEPATAYGLTALHGSSPDVGVVGYTLGGGIGWLARRYGLAANSVTAVELVTADGEHVRADADNEPDLFWGVRGGSGNFGAVTAIEFALYPVEHAYAGWLVWPWERSRDVLTRWAELTETFPDTITSLARILRLPPAPFIPEPFRGRDLVVVEAAYLGEEERGRELLAPLRELNPEMDTFATVPALALTRLHQDPEGPTPGAGDGGMFDRLTPEAIDAYLEVTGPGSDSPLISAEIRQLGGALGTPAPGGGALSYLDGGFVNYSVGIAPTPEAAAAAAARAALAKETLGRYGRGRSYANFAEHATDADSIFGQRHLPAAARAEDAGRPGPALQGGPGDLDEVAEHGDRLQILVREVLEHRALDARRLVGAQTLGDLVQRPVEGRLALRLLRDRAPAGEPLLRVGAVAADDAAGHHREDQRLAARLAGRVVEDLPPLAGGLERRKDRVVLVGEAHGCAHPAWFRRAADDDRRARLLHRLRPRPALGRPLAVDLLELPLELVEALAGRGEGQAVGLVLGLVPAGADSELDPAAGDVVDRDHVLRQHRGRPERDRRDHRPEPDPLGHRGERGQRRPGVEGAGGRAAEDGEVVVGAEQPLEADALGGAGERAPLLPGDPLLALDHQAQAHGRSLDRKPKRCLAGRPAERHLHRRSAEGAAAVP